jgi:hypothetical protein
MLLGAPLPGSALVPGFFFSKTQKHDDRELYLVLEHPTWAVVAKVDPDKSNKMRQLAIALNQEVRRHPAESAKTAEPLEENLVSQLQALSQLHASGALSEDEFSRAKQRLLDQS